MQLLAVIVSFIVAANAVSDEDQWELFKATHQKSYKNTREEIRRFQIFQNNLMIIAVHNKRFEDGNESYQLGVNRFADLTQEEFAELWSMPEIDPDQPDDIFHSKENAAGALSVDWREKGAVLDVQTQAACGSCWAFSAVGSIEGQNAIKHNTKIPLSAQELVDCSLAYGSRGCIGGWMHYAYAYMKDHGISAQKDYEYEGRTSRCKNSTAARANVTITGFVFVDPNEEALRQAVETIGPISVTLYSGNIHLYEKGIFDYENCPKDRPTHAVLAVGYGSENGIEYWIMKNSWGKNWGESGYFRIVRNKNNTCGLCSHPMYPIIL